MIMMLFLCLVKNIYDSVHNLSKNVHLRLHSRILSHHFHFHLHIHLFQHTLSNVLQEGSRTWNEFKIQAIERRRLDLYPSLRFCGCGFTPVIGELCYFIWWSTRLTVFQSQLAMSRVGQSAWVVDMFVGDADHAAVEACAEVSGEGTGAELMRPLDDFIGQDESQVALFTEIHIHHRFI